MTATMDMADLERVNRLWDKIYPFLADQILEYFPRGEGDFLEWGPFSGGISYALLTRHPGLRGCIAVEEEPIYRLMAKTTNAVGLVEKIGLARSGLHPLAMEDGTFDLIVIRGAFFFLDSAGASLRELYRVLKQGGVGFVGGGYGKNTTPDLIHEIADESRILNDRLGRIRVTVPALSEMIQHSALSGQVRIVEEGGLWLLLRKG